MFQITYHQFFFFVLQFVLRKVVRVWGRVETETKTTISLSYLRGLKDSNRRRRNRVERHEGSWISKFARIHVEAIITSLSSSRLTVFPPFFTR